MLYLVLHSLVYFFVMLVILYFITKKVAKGLSFIRLVGSVIAAEVGTIFIIGLLEGPILGRNEYLTGLVSAIIFVVILRFFVIDFMENKKDFIKVGGIVLVSSFVIDVVSRIVLTKMLGL